MSKSLKFYITGLVSVSVVALVLTSFVFFGRTDHILGMRPDIAPGILASDQLDMLLGLGFWILLTLIASAVPVRMPRGTLVTVAIAPVIAAMALGGPLAAASVAAIGTTEMRELRGRVPWYGTLANHAGSTLPALLGGVAADFVYQIAHLGFQPRGGDLVVGLAATMIGAGLFVLANVLATAVVVSLRTGERFSVVALGDAKGFAVDLFALAPLAWLMAQMYIVAFWATLLFALPLATTRLAYAKFVEMREMFTQTIGALAEAVDKRDPFTSKHSQRVKQIAVDIGREMNVSEGDLEALEWGGLLHDVGKIGVPDAVLLKQERLTREERMIMNAHPVLGAQIIAPVTKLAPELPIIRHHHEWYNGSGYPDRLIGDEIPKLARILHVADAFEAMTAARPYRMTPLTGEQALAELRKFAGIQFDPAVVDAFVRTTWVEGIHDPARMPEPRPIPLLSQAAGRMTKTPGGDASSTIAADTA